MWWSGQSKHTDLWNGQYKYHSNYWLPQKTFQFKPICTQLTNFKASSSHNSILTITIITGFCPQICTLPGLITDNQSTAKPHPTIWQKPTYWWRPVHPSGPLSDFINRWAEIMWITWLADMTETSALVTDTFIGLNTEALQPGQDRWSLGMESGGASKSDKRLLCLRRLQ